MALLPTEIVIDDNSIVVLDKPLSDRAIILRPQTSSLRSTRNPSITLLGEVTLARDSNAHRPAGATHTSAIPSPDAHGHAATGSIRLDGGSGRSSHDDSGGVSPFEIGDVLAGRYRIKRFLGRGGMGEVFEVEDLILHSAVALKTIRPSEADRSEAIERFKREINVARRVTHPNVCRLFDVGTHIATAADGRTRETLFLTMELLSGQNLSDRLDNGRLTTEEALPILSGVAQGLGAAHRAGVLHRDLKAANIMIGAASPSGPMRAVVTDFGLARTIERDPNDGLASISQSGVVVGTPAYMSPEQVRGEPLTAASDIYALGLVLYEMVTGQRPFEGGSAWSIAVRRLTQPPPQPRAVIPDLDPGWDAAITACLQLDPLLRPKSPEEVLDLVKSGGRSDETRAISSSPRASVGSAVGAAGLHGAWQSDRRLWAALIGLVGLVLVGTTFWPGSARAPVTTEGESSTPPVAVPSIKARPSLVILGIGAATPGGGDEWLGLAISEVLGASLASDGKLRVPPNSEGQRVSRELDLGPAVPSPSQIAQIRVMLGADFGVVGSVSPMESGSERLIRLELTLLDLTAATTLASSSAVGTEAALTDLTMRASEALRKPLALSPLTATRAKELDAFWPTPAPAARLAAEGWLKLQRSDFRGARLAFEQAVRLAPKHPMPHAGLASALSSMSYAAEAKSEAAIAVGLMGDLSQEQRLWLSGQALEAGRNWKDASQSYQTLLTLAPDNLDYGVRLAETQNLDGKAQEALQTLARLRGLPKALSADPRIDLAAARAHQRMGDLKSQLTLAAAASQAALKQNARTVAANALLVESHAHESLGDRAAARRAAEEAQRLFEAAGDRTGAARALERVALGIYRSGDLDGSRRLFDRALTMHAENGDTAGMSRARSNLANIAYRQGDRAAAERLDTEAIAGFRQVGARAEMAAAFNNIATRLHTAGDLSGAQKRYKEALDVFIEIKDRRRVALTLGNLAEVWSARGELKNAEATLEDSLAAWRELGDQGEAAYTVTRLGDVATLRGDLIVARDRFDEALRIQEDLKERLAMAETRVSMARLAMVSGKATEAETLARAAEEVLRSEQAGDAQTLASLALAEALLAQGKLAEAKERARALMEAATASGNAGLAADYSILSARILAASGDTTGALAALEKSRLANSRNTLVEHDFRIRLAAGQIEIKGGRAKTGRTQLLALAKEANARGFGLVSRLAAEAAGS